MHNGSWKITWMAVGPTSLTPPYRSGSGKTEPLADNQTARLTGRYTH